MNPARLTKTLAYFSIALLIACGAALLGPLWHMPYPDDLTGSRIYPSTDENSFYIVSGLVRNNPLKVEQFDLSGNSISLHTHETINQSKFISKLSTNAIYVGNGSDPIETLLYINLETGEERAAFATPDLSQYLSQDLSVGVVDRHDNLIISGRVEATDNTQLYLIGKLRPNGDFVQYVTPNHYIRTQIFPMQDGNNLAVLAEPTRSESETTGIKKTLMFFDTNLNLINQFEFKDDFYGSYALNDGLYGHFISGEHIGAIRKVDLDGHVSTAPADFSQLDYAFGDDHFYMVRYRNDLLNGHRRACRFNYNLERLNCFNISIEGDYDDFEVTPDGGLALTEYNYSSNYHFESAGITIENVEAAILGQLKVSGYEGKTLRQRSFSSQGKLILNSHPALFKRKGYFELCYDSLSGITFVCLVEESREPGT